MSSETQYSKVVHLARTLISIPSVNPVLADDPAISGEHRMADFIAGYLGERGFVVTRHEKTPNRPNIVAAFGPQQPRHTLMIEAHLDTQGIQGMTVPPFEGVIKDGRLYGRGACDMKGPMAAALVNLTPECLKQLAAAGIRLIFVAAMGEETGNLGALELVEAGIGADEILVLEPTDLHIVHAHKGAFWFEVEVKGIAAHGSNPGHGCNAIAGMSHVIDCIRRQTEHVALNHPLLGRPTANVGIIRGGTSINIVPETCLIQVDRRTVPGEDSEVIMSQLRAGLAELAAEGHFVEARVGKIKEGKPFETTSDAPVVQRLSRALDDQGIPPVCEGAAWYSDAGPFARTCREIAVFGPGSIRQAHTADEYIALAELEQGAAVIGHFLRRLAHDESNP